MKTYFDIIRLHSGHSLILGHLPLALTIDQVADKLFKDGIDIEKFGLFDTAAPNFSNYYPDVKPEEFSPKDGEIAYPIVRALSEVVVHKSINPIDFSQPGILRESLPLLISQSVYPNHEAAVGNELGSVKDTFYQAAYEMEANGKKVMIPAGMNARLAIDGKSNPKIVRGINMDPPSVHSLSVTVAFDWQKSHSSLSDQEFFQKLGSFGEDGKLIRRIVTKVKRYNEISFVSHGADPYAQVISGGKINNPTFADIVYNSEKPQTKFFFYDYKGLDEISLHESILNNLHNNENNPDMNKALLDIAKLYNIDPSKFNTEELLSAEISRLKAEADTSIASIATLKETANKVSDLETQLNSTKTELAAEKAKNDDGNKAITKLRDETYANFKLSSGKDDTAMQEKLNKMGFDALTVLHDEYKKKVDEKFPIECKDCGSHNVSRQSSLSGDPTKTSNPEKPKSHNETLSSLRSAHTRKNNLNLNTEVKEKEKK